MEKRYWPYFRDSLGYPEIQFGGPLALLAEAEGGELDALYESGVKLREQFFPALGEKESVLEHGRGRGVPRHLLEDDERFRTRVMNAWGWQWLAGRVHGLERIFEAYGFPVVAIPPVEHPDHWAEFDLLVESPPGEALTEAAWELLYWIIFEYKRASAMLRTLRIAKRLRGGVKIGAAAAVGEKVTLYPPPAGPAPARAKLGGGGKAVTHEKWRMCLGQRTGGGRLCAARDKAPVLEKHLSFGGAAATHERWTIGRLI